MDTIHQSRINSLDDFVKVASLCVDLDGVETITKKAAFSFYKDNPGISANILSNGINNDSDPVTKKAFEMIGAAVCYDAGLLKDYGANQDLAKHAGLQVWMDSHSDTPVDKVASMLGMAGKGLKLGLGTNKGMAAVGTVGATGFDASQKKNGLAQGNLDQIHAQESTLNQ